MPFSNSDPYHARGYPPRMRFPSSASIGHTSPPHSSSHRPHPYRRSPNPNFSTTTPQPEQLPRITLPPPNLGGGTFKFASTYDAPSPRDREYPSLMHEASWRSPSTTAGRPVSSEGMGEHSRTPSQRLASDGRMPLHLPPLHSISGGSSSRAGETSPSTATPTMYPPTRGEPIPSSSSSSRVSPRSRPPPPPSYVDYEPSYPRPPVHGHGHDSHHRHNAGSIYRAEERYRDESYDRGPPPPGFPPQHAHAVRPHMYDPPSPIRQVQHAPPGMTQLQFGPPEYYGGTPPDAGMGMGMGMGMGRQRSHSSAPGFSRPTTGEEEGKENAAGQSRRVAHLMSEQKRRESINSGFQALRTTVPTTSATDSKAIILKKAVAHINHLEGLLKRHNIEFTPGEAWEDAEDKKDQ
ncbi:hypothetical protein IAR50_000104 [Cryptococcus sp. DSM 104548]